MTLTELSALERRLRFEETGGLESRAAENLRRTLRNVGLAKRRIQQRQKREKELMKCYLRFRASGGEEFYVDESGKEVDADTARKHLVTTEASRKPLVEDGRFEDKYGPVQTVINSMTSRATEQERLQAAFEALGLTAEEAKLAARGAEYANELAEEEKLDAMLLELKRSVQ